MELFQGEFECKLDGKGRLVLPFRLKAKLPKDAQNQLVINRGFEPCLVIYSIPEWEKISARVSSLNEFNEEDRIFQRNFGRGNTEVELEDNARFNIPKSMLTYAGIEKTAIIIGLGNRMEIWNPDKYNDFLIKDPSAFSKLAQKVLGTKEVKE